MAEENIQDVFVISDDITGAAVKYEKIVNGETSSLHWVKCAAKMPQVSCSQESQGRNLYLQGYC